jgi:membrane-bound serine protease (ClpP class)
LLNPQIAHLLLMGGLAGLFFALISPGTAIFTGVLGGLCLLLGLYALAILPTNVAGLLLILFGLLLFALEFMVVSFGLLSIAAAIAIFFGSVILFRFEYGIEYVPITSILVATISLTALILFCLYRFVIKAHKKKPVQDSDILLGQKAVVRQWNSTNGFIHIQGESWSAVSNRPLELSPGDTVYVTAIQGLTLTVDHEFPTQHLSPRSLL